MLKLASIHRKQGHLELADQALRLGVPDINRLDRYYQPRVLTALAELRMAQGRPRDADQLFRQAEDVLDNLIAKVRKRLEMAAVSGAMSETYVERFKLAKDQGKVTAAFQVLERVRGRTALGPGPSDNRSEKQSAVTAWLDAKIANLQLALAQTEDRKARSSLLDKLPEYESGQSLFDAQVELESVRGTTCGSTEASVPILGESGTGKELIARALHERIARAPAEPWSRSTAHPSRATSLWTPIRPHFTAQN